MIKIEHLTKIYDKKGTPALDDVSFALPDKGFVFIVGKSGSGKSTLLNMLGGLDNITSGDVIADGNKFSELSEKDFNDYRNSFVGFIFQDFCLMEMLTVEENIKLSLDLQKTIDDEKVKQIIKRVDLEGFEKRPVKKLSGGQKQRVAIARALIKKPKLILADEPTGNLDSKTSVQILNLLKSLSKDNLVVIVSHNTADAYKYADRIIEISDGKIVKDIENTGETNKLIISGDSITLPYNSILTDAELAKINKHRKDKKIKQHKPLFAKTVQPEDTDKKREFKKSSLRNTTICGLSGSFLKKRSFSFVLTIVLMSAMLIVFGLCQMFVLYDSTKTIKDAFQNSTDPAFVLKKGYFSDDLFKEVKTDKLGRITDADIQAFYDAGYSGKIYQFTNATIGHQTNLETFKPVNTRRNFQEFYARESLGMLECDEEFLIELFGNKNGEIEVLAGTLDYTTKPHGMILTDYMADSYIYHHKEFMGTLANPYEKLINGGMIDNRFAVLAVIDTGYKERYADLIAKYKAYFSATTKLQKETLYKEIISGEEYVDFYTELTDYLSITYSTNPNYRQDAITNFPDSRIVGYFSNVDFYDSTNKFLYNASNAQVTPKSWKPTLPDLQNNEIYVTPQLYNALFGTEISFENATDFQEQTISVQNYDSCRDLDDKPLFTKTYIIKGLADYIVVSDEEFKFIRQYDVYTTGLYFDSSQNCGELYYTIQETEYYLGSQNYKAIYQIVDVVGIFKEYFGLIVSIIVLVIVLVLFSFGMGNIKSRQKEIGILRALGCSTKDLTKIFFIHSLLMGVFTALISVVGIVSLTQLTNSLLIAGFKTYINSPVIALIEGINILSLSPQIIFADLGIVFVLTLASGLIPLVAIHRIKPMKIIRSKD